MKKIVTMLLGVMMLVSSIALIGCRSFGTDDAVHPFDDKSKVIVEIFAEGSDREYIKFRVTEKDDFYDRKVVFTYKYDSRKTEEYIPYIRLTTEDGVGYGYYNVDQIWVRQDSMIQETYIEVSQINKPGKYSADVSIYKNEDFATSRTFYYFTLNIVVEKEIVNEEYK